MKKYTKQSFFEMQIIENSRPSLDHFVPEGTRRLIQQALQEEMNAVLGQAYYEHYESDEENHYQNNYRRQ